MIANFPTTLTDSQLPHGEAPGGFVPPDLFPSQDLTDLALRGMIPSMVTPAPRGEPHAEQDLPQLLNDMARGLYRRRSRHLLVTGARGVGKTTLLWELARQAAVGQIPFLKASRFLWVDVQDAST